MANNTITITKEFVSHASKIKYFDNLLEIIIRVAFTISSNKQNK